jgi:adenine-specific DNA methylase
MDAIVGNPPFIRYQRFNGDLRKYALKICRQVGVDLPELSSSWAPFLIHATQFLKLGGRLAMVVPAEINHAAYAIPVIQYFLEKFRSIRTITAKFGHKNFMVS